MTNAFLKPSHPILRKVAKEVPISRISSKEMQSIISGMLKIAYGEQKDSKKPIMVGLAAPQIGISKRIILVDVSANGKGGVGNLKVYINPEIIWNSKRKEEWYEGCYSIPGICGIVKRPNSVKIRAFTMQPRWAISPRSGLQPKFVEEKHTGYVARIFQHEIDHLNGKVFINHIKDPDKLHKVKKREFALYRKSWRNWPKKYPLPLDTTM